MTEGRRAQRGRLLAWVCGPISRGRGRRPVQGWGPYLASSSVNAAGGTQGLKSTFSQVYTCSVLPCTSVNKAFCSCPDQAAPWDCVCRKTVTTALVRSCSGASVTAGGMRGRLSSLCQASLHNVRSCVHKSDAIDLPTVGPKLCVGFFFFSLNSWGLHLHWPTHTLSLHSPRDPRSIFALSYKCKEPQSAYCEDAGLDGGPVTY